MRTKRDPASGPGTGPEKGPEKGSEMGPEGGPEKGSETGRGKGPKRADGRVATAVAVGAAQLPAAWALWWEHDLATDPYGRSYSSLALLFVFLFAPVYLPVLGLLHACTQTLPGAALARLAHGRLRWPRWVRHLAATVLVGAGWGALAAVLWGLPFGTTVLVLTALAVLPVLATAYARRRSWGAWSVWWRAAAGSAALFVLALAAGTLATAAGLIEEYEPPRLTADEVAGVWRGRSGAELRLGPGGRAEVVRMPAEAGFGEEPVTCDGTGTWVFEEGPGAWDGVAVRLDSGRGTGSACGDEVTWSVGGTDRAPELFRFLGDPDAQDLRILEPAGG
ncbi:hypothetical protein [Streptomyces sp. NPDC001388]|uniref:hypothetical protein n=1 Tax=Streptomyces sp. NPDC001388 TaxID=3364568 RepID=UPI00368EB742